MVTRYRLSKAALLSLALPISLAWAPQAASQQPAIAVPAILSAKPLESGSGEDRLMKLRKALYNERKEIALGRYRAFRLGRGTFDALLVSIRRLRQAGMQIYKEPRDQRKLLTELRDLTRDLGDIVSERKRQLEAAGKVRGPSSDMHDMQLEAWKIIERSVHEFVLELEIDTLTLENATDSKKK